MKRVSICIPVYNMGHWLGETLDSVLAQTRPADEILIWDDGSTDNTRDVALQYAEWNKNIRVSWSDINQGPSVGTEQMVKLSLGDYILHLAADDTIAPTYLEKVLAEFDAYPEALMVSCHPTFMDADGAYYDNPGDARCQIPKPCNWGRDNLLQILKLGNLYFGVNTFRRDCFDIIGKHDGSLEWLQDWEYYIRLLKHGDTIRVVEEPLCKYRLHDGALSMMTLDKSPRQNQYVRTIRERHYPPARRKIVLASPHYKSLCNSQFMRSVVNATNWLTSQGIAWDLIELNGDSYVDRAKNTICMQFLEGDGTDLLMLDDDMEWSVDAVQRIINFPQEIVAGSFPMKNSWENFVGDPMVRDGSYVGIPLSDGSSLLQARRVAGGFLRMKRSALVKFCDAYPERIYRDPTADPNARARIYNDFFECHREGYVRYGEDMYFSELCIRAGIELWIDPNITFGHYGSQGWFGNMHNARMKPPEPVLEAAE